VPGEYSCTAAIPAHSIATSARASSIAGTVMPNALAVFMLIVSSNLMGCSTSGSSGFVLQYLVNDDAGRAFGDPSCVLFDTLADGPDNLATPRGR
jgi:hypothetical protein